MMRIKFQQLIVSICFSCFLSATCQAEEYAYPILVVKSMKLKKAQENEDELYFTIFEQVENKSQLFRQPDFPLYFSSSRLTHLSDFPIWRGFLRKGEKIHLQLTLMEQDFPPWNPDDYISTIEIDIYFTGSNLRAKWQVLGEHRMSFSTQGNHQTKLVHMISKNANYATEFILSNGSFEFDKKTPILSIGYPFYPLQPLTPYMIDSIGLSKHSH